MYVPLLLRKRFRIKRAFPFSDRIDLEARKSAFARVGLRFYTYPFVIRIIASHTNEIKRIELYVLRRRTVVLDRFLAHHFLV